MPPLYSAPWIINSSGLSDYSVVEQTNIESKAELSQPRVSLELSQDPDWTRIRLVILSALVNCVPTLQTKFPSTMQRLFRNLRKQVKKPHTHSKAERGLIINQAKN